MHKATLLLLFPAAALASMSTCTQKDGQNNKGTNMEKTARKTGNAGDCCSQCLDTSNCVGYTWRKDSNECWLKSAVDSLTPDAVAVSGSVGSSPSPSTCTQKDGQNNKGTNMETTARKTGNAGDCCSQCLDTSKCVGYTWKKDNSECWLKSAVGSLTPDATAVSGSVGSPSPPAPSPPSPSLPQYCPTEQDMNIDYGGNIRFHGNGWTISGSGRVSSKTSWNLLGGSIEFDMDVSDVQPGVNNNVYTSSPSKPNCGKSCYCDIQANGSPVCMEMDILENNGKCKMASTWHSAGGTGGDKGYCDAWGCGALADLPSSGKFHIKSSFTADGDWLTTLDGTPVDNWGGEKPVDKDRQIVKSTMSGVGGAIESSQWTGWVPGSGCPSGGDLTKSVFTVTNLTVTGSVIQGPEPTKCGSTVLI